MATATAAAIRVMITMIMTTIAAIASVATAQSYLPCERLSKVGNAGACAWAGGISGTCGWRESDRTCTSCYDLSEDSCNTDVCAWLAPARYNYCAGRNTSLYNDGHGDRCNMVLQHEYLGMQACTDYLDRTASTTQTCVMKMAGGRPMCASRAAKLPDAPP